MLEILLHECALVWVSARAWSLIGFPPAVQVGLQPGSYQELKIPPITKVKQKSQMPGIRRRGFVLSWVQTRPSADRHPGEEHQRTHRQGCTSTLSSCARPSAHSHWLAARTAVGSGEYRQAVLRHRQDSNPKPQRALVQFHAHHSPSLCLREACQGRLSATDSVPTRIRKASLSGEKAEL